ASGSVFRNERTVRTPGTFCATRIATCSWLGSLTSPFNDTIALSVTTSIFVSSNARSAEIFAFTADVIRESSPAVVVAALLELHARGNTAAMKRKIKINFFISDLHSALMYGPSIVGGVGRFRNRLWHLL